MQLAHASMRLWLRSTGLLLAPRAASPLPPPRTAKKAEVAADEPSSPPPPSAPNANKGAKVFTASPATAAVAEAKDTNSSPVPSAAQWERIYERTLATDRALAAQKDLIAQLQRQQLLLERRVALAEEATASLESQVGEVRRAAGGVVLEQRNTEALVAQMEERVRHMVSVGQTAANSVVTAAAAEPSTLKEESCVAKCAETKGDDGEVAEENEDREREETLEIIFNDELRAEVVALIRETLQKEGATPPLTTPAPAAATLRAPSTSSQGAGVATNSGKALTNTAETGSLLGRVAALDRRLASLQAYVDQLAIHKVDLTRVAAASITPPSSSTSPQEVSLAGDAAVAGRAAAVATELRLRAAYPFADPSGETRLASQCLALRHVPANLGAAEVRALCVRAAGGRPDAVVACVVKRPVPTPAAGGGRATGFGRSPSPPSSYASQRVFHVTFASTHLALAAMRELGGLALHPVSDRSGGASGGSGMGSPLVAEPVVSADVEAALHFYNTASRHQKPQSPLV